MAIVINGSGTVTGISVGGLPDDIVDAGTLADNAVGLAQMAGGTDGNIITYDTSGNPAVVATGSSGQVLTSAGADAVPTMATLSAGKVKQIQFINSTTQLVVESTVEADSGWAVSITPTSASSKIFCMFTSVCGNNDVDKYIKVRLYRDSTAIAEIHTERSSYYDFNMATIHYMDAPSTTSATTYKITVQSSASSHQGHLGINSTTTNMILMEVDA